MLLKNKNKIGFSLIELLLVLSVIAAFAIVAFMLYPKVQSSQKADTEIKNIMNIVAGIDSLYKSSANFTGINERTLIDAKIIPDQMRVGNTYRVINVWKGPVSFNYGTSDYTINYNSVPSAECAKIVSSTISIFKYITIGDNEGYDEEGNEVGINGKVTNENKSISEITRYCSNKNNVVSFTY